MRFEGHLGARLVKVNINLCLPGSGKLSQWVIFGNEAPLSYLELSVHIIPSWKKIRAIYSGLIHHSSIVANSLYTHK